MLPCGCARGHCEAADVADCRRIQALVVDFDTDKYDPKSDALVGMGLGKSYADRIGCTIPMERRCDDCGTMTCVPVRVVWHGDTPRAVASGREKLVC